MTTLHIELTSVVQISPNEAGVVDVVINGQDALFGDFADPANAFKGWKRAADYADGVVETAIGPELRRKSVVRYHRGRNDDYYVAEVTFEAGAEQAIVVMLVRE